jgi:hypothetical protein
MKNRNVEGGLKKQNWRRNLPAGKSPYAPYTDLRCVDDLRGTGAASDVSFLLFLAWKGSTIVRFKFLETIMEDLLTLEVATAGRGMRDLIGNSVGTRLGFFGHELTSQGHGRGILGHEDLTSQGHGRGILEADKMRWVGETSAVATNDIKSELMIESVRVDSPSTLV